MGIVSRTRSERILVVENWSELVRLVVAGLRGTPSAEITRDRVASSMSRAALALRLLDNPCHDDKGQFCETGGGGKDSDAAKAEHVAGIVAKYGPAHAGYEHGVGKYSIPYKPHTPEYHKAQSKIYQQAKKEAAKLEKQDKSSAPAPGTKPMEIVSKPSADSPAAAPSEQSLKGFGITSSVVSALAAAFSKIEAVNLDEMDDGISSKAEHIEQVKDIVEISDLADAAKEYGVSEASLNAYILHGGNANEAAIYAKQDAVTFGKEQATTAALEEPLMAHTKSQGFSTNVQNAIANYTGKGFENMNGFLRGQMTEKQAGERYVRDAKQLYEALATASNFPTPVTVYRGQGDVPKDFVAGAEVTLKGFQSTSIDPSKAFGGTTKWTIKTSKGVYVKPYSSTKTEKEVLLNHGTRVRIISREDKPTHNPDGSYNQHTTHIHAEVIG